MPPSRLHSRCQMSRLPACRRHTKMLPPHLDPREEAFRQTVLPSRRRAQAYSDEISAYTKTGDRRPQRNGSRSILSPLLTRMRSMTSKGCLPILMIKSPLVSLDCRTGLGTTSVPAISSVEYHGPGLEALISPLCIRYSKAESSP